MNALGDAVVRCGEANRWVGAAAAMLFWDLYGAAMPAVRIVLTLHNMDSTGECSQEEFAFTGAFTPALLLAASPLVLRHRAKEVSLCSGQ